MENKIDNLKNIEIEVEGKKLLVFERFPNFIPYIGEEYGSGNHKKLLLIWESYYTTKSVPEILEKPSSWYFDAKDDEIEKIFGNKKNHYEHHWNFASKMHKDGIDRKSPTFQNVEKILDKFSIDKNSFKYCAGYNYYLRPALDSSSIKSDKLDEEVARETLKAIIQVLEPDAVIFFSKKANASFKPYRVELEHIKYKAFVHPASAWWNRKSGKEPQKTGKKRFEEFIEELYQQNFNKQKRLTNDITYITNHLKMKNNNTETFRDILVYRNKHLQVPFSKKVKITYRLVLNSLKIIKQSVFSH